MRDTVQVFFPRVFAWGAPLLNHGLLFVAKGPIHSIRSKLQNDFSCEIVEPPLLMPPFFGLSFASLWCFDLNFCLMMLVLFLGLFCLLEVWVQFESSVRFIYMLVLLGIIGYWIRLMVAVVARSAIHDGVEKCLKEMRRNNVVLCVGFSWGAGVLSELLTREIRLENRPAFVLIAPVSAASAIAAMRADAALRLRPLDDDFVKVIHASDDPMFCPHPERWNAVRSIECKTLFDNHVFKNISSRRAIGEIVTALYRKKTEEEGNP